MNYKEEDEYFDKSIGRDDEVDDGHSISKLELEDGFAGLGIGVNPFLWVLVGLES